MFVWVVLALFAAAVEAFAVQKNILRLEFIAKPAVMVFLFIWLYVNTGLQGNAVWFGLGILFSLMGDIVLMSASNRMFVLGLAAFLLTHVFYLIGFKDELTSFTAWSFILFLLIYINGLRLMRRLVSSVRAAGQQALVVPVTVYGVIISLMLYAALSTIFDPSWTTNAAFLVSVGAFLFYLSDLILGWNKFVTPMTHGRVLNIVAYHLGQISLIAGIMSQFN